VLVTRHKRLLTLSAVSVPSTSDHRYRNLIFDGGSPIFWQNMFINLCNSCVRTTLYWTSNTPSLTFTVTRSASRSAGIGAGLGGGGISSLSVMPALVRDIEKDFGRGWTGGERWGDLETETLETDTWRQTRGGRGLETEAWRLRLGSQIRRVRQLKRLEVMERVEVQEGI